MPFFGANARQQADIGTKAEPQATAEPEEGPRPAVGGAHPPWIHGVLAGDVDDQLMFFF